MRDARTEDAGQHMRMDASYTVGSGLTCFGLALCLDRIDNQPCLALACLLAQSSAVHLYCSGELTFALDYFFRIMVLDNI